MAIEQVTNEQALDPDIEHQSTMGCVTDELAASGFLLPDPPDFPMPKLRPSDLTHSDQARYGQQFAQFANWETYAFKVLAYIKGWIIEYENKLKRLVIKARLKARRAKLPGDKLTEKSILDSVESSPLYMKYADELQMLEQKKLIVEAQYKEAEVGVFTFSRYINVREGERRMEGGRRF